jgi:AcrR family transcriptional regulator
MPQVSPAARVHAALPTLPPRAPRDGTAGRILAAALLLFARRSYDGTSIRDLGDELGLKAANLYAYFRSKEHLLAALARLGHEEHQDRLRKALVDSPPGAAAQLRAIVRAHVRFHVEYAMLATVANNEMHALSPELAAPSLALRQQSEALFTDVVARGVARGLFHAPHPFVTVAAIAGMGMRVAPWYRPDFELSPAELADAHAELAARMVGVAEPRRR